MKHSWGGEVQNVSVLVEIGVNSDGCRALLKVAEGSREDKESWNNFFRYLKERGLNGVKLVFSDKASGLVEARLRHISTTKRGTRQYLACKMGSW